MVTKRKTVLVVDDEESIRSLVRKVLSSRYAILEASNGKEGIEVARTYKPDLVLMDIMMPNTDGYTACHEIKKDKTTSKIPVVMVSAVGHELNVKLSTEMGARAHLTKPFDVHRLLEEVQQIIG